MLGDLPPSSSAMSATCSAASFMTLEPTAVDPVNDTLSTPGWRASALPAGRPGPVRTLIVPGGKPASEASAANASEDAGVWSAVLATIVQPAASAGAIFITRIITGLFHGTI